MLIGCEMTITEWYFCIGFVIAVVTTGICYANGDKVTWYGFLLDMTLWFIVVLWIAFCFFVLLWGYNRDKRV
jgi:hypothetical protein